MIQRNEIAEITFPVRIGVALAFKHAGHRIVGAPNKEIQVNLQVTRRMLAGFSIVALIAIVVGCTTPSSSMSPTGPTAVVASSAAAAVSFSPNPTPPPVCESPNLIVNNECVPPPPPPDGVPCSPGYWKNHESAFLAACGPASLLPGARFTSCPALMTALKCKGAEPGCGRHDAAAQLNTITACTESD